jgi:hypothetical protein
MFVSRRVVACIGGVAWACSFGIGCSGDASSNGATQTGAVVGAPQNEPATTPGVAMKPAPINVPIDTHPTGMAGAGVPMTSGTGGAGSGSPMTMPQADPGMAGAGAMMTGSGGASSMMPTTAVSLDECTAPPAGTADNAVKAWTLLNQTRLATGSGCMNSVPELISSAQKHCDYAAANSGNASCVPDAHSEVMSCSGFTGKDVQSREVAAGYPQMLAYTEVMTTFGNNPPAALPNWIDTVYHRIPLLDPWTADMGYGGAAGCDTIDIGRGMSSVPADTIVTYPYDGQTNVPPTWNGLEGPAPPAPSGGWPSSYVINIYAQGISITEHVLTKDGDDTPLEHVFLDINSPEVAGLKPYFKNTAFLYGAPFELNTKYHVKVAGTHTGGALNLEWTFTTGATRPFGT